MTSAQQREFYLRSLRNFCTRDSFETFKTWDRCDPQRQREKFSGGCRKNSHLPLAFCIIFSRITAIVAIFCPSDKNTIVRQKQPTATSTCQWQSISSTSSNHGSENSERHKERARMSGVLRIHAGHDPDLQHRTQLLRLVRQTTEKMSFVQSENIDGPP
jgi:hypothetical protein